MHVFDYLYVVCVAFRRFICLLARNLHTYFCFHSNTGLEDLDLNADFLSDYTSALNGDFNNPTGVHEVRSKHTKSLHNI